jgi:hypothetical protein
MTVQKKRSFQKLETNLSFREHPQRLLELIPSINQLSALRIKVSKALNWVFKAASADALLT